ncbi:MAG TPA: glycosyltransferase family 4 protein [Rikenellaceae bacterium]|nr:glycosyltransferase family 4 protein [Rikenellaceae bacterium]
MKYKIAYCIPAIYTPSGMERSLTIKANYFVDVLGYDVTIVLTDGAGREPAFKLSDKVKIINLNINYDKIWSYPIYLKIFVYMIKQVLYRSRLSAALNKIKPDITISLLRREINFLTKIKDGSVKIGEMHFNRLNYRDFNTKGERSGVKSFLAKLWMRQLISNLKKLDKFVVLSNEDNLKWTELDNTAVIYNPIETIPVNISDCSAKKVISAGRFAHQKGFDMLIDAWKIVTEKHPDWTLTIYGPGSKETFNNQIYKNGLSSNCFLEETVLNLNEKFAESSIFAFSSRFEGFGMVITEAMACGIPPVAFACPCGPRDIITDGKDGLLAEPENIRDLALKIVRLIDDEQLRKSMGANAITKSERFRMDVIAKEWAALFNELIN